ncbi:MAG: hypothetical protein E7591_08030 [Ruminococcaceae bacterium]|nr:hypothetical protein [Oscillospiraceae bacterium]
MRKYNALIIQEKLRTREYITIPDIQLEFFLHYVHAKEFLEQLICRGWVANEPEGLKYPVLKSYMALRRIERSEVDTFIERITVDAATALMAVVKRSARGGASYKDIYKEVRGERDTREAVRLLIECRLIYKFNDRYFSCVSENTALILSALSRKKIDLDCDEDAPVTQDYYEVLRDLFEPLFAEE